MTLKIKSTELGGSKVSFWAKNTVEHVFTLFGRTIGALGHIWSEGEILLFKNFFQEISVLMTSYGLEMTSTGL